MGAFKYEGLTRDGKRVQGEIEAVNQQEARTLLRRQGIRTKKIEKPSIFAEADIMVMIKDFTGAVGFDDNDLARFTKQFGTLIDAGVPILQSLDILYKQEKNVAFKKTLLRVIRGIADGKTLYEALKDEPGVSKLYSQLIKAGEVAGILDEIIQKLDVFLEKRLALIKKIKGAMTYPLIVSFIGVAVVAGLLTFVVPQFVSMLESGNQEIPWITQFVIDISEFFQEYIMHMFFGVAGIVFAFSRYFFKTVAGRNQYDRVMLKVPLIKHIVIKGNLSSFSQTLATMLSSGVSLTDSLEVCADVMSNGVIGRDIKRIRAAVMAGKSISEPLKRIDYFPDLIVQMISVGESTGNLDTMLTKVSDVFELEVDGSISTMTQMIEPILIVVLAIIVGTVLLAMYMPVFVAGGAV